MTTPSLEASVKQAAAVGSEPSRCGFELSRNILLGVRESRARRPDLVVQFGTYLLDHHAQRLGHEVWNVYEQVLVALLEHGKQPSEGRGKSKRAVQTGQSEPLATAQDYCNILALQFPKSLRVKRLEAMLWEAKGELDMAMADYEEILKEDPNHLAALKRQAALNPAHVVCASLSPSARIASSAQSVLHLCRHLTRAQVALLRSRGRAGDAASKLVEHVEVVCSDTDAWLQLSEIYLAAMRFRRAAFCIEELLLVNPMAHMCVRTMPLARRSRPPTQAQRRHPPLASPPPPLPRSARRSLLLSRQVPRALCGAPLHDGVRAKGQRGSLSPGADGSVVAHLALSPDPPPTPPAPPPAPAARPGPAPAHRPFLHLAKSDRAWHPAEPARLRLPGCTPTVLCPAAPAGAQVLRARAGAQTDAQPSRALRFAALLRGHQRCQGC